MRREDVNYIIQPGKLGGLDKGEFATSLEVTFGVIDTRAEIIGKRAKAIFEAEVVIQKEELFAHLHKVEKQREDYADTISSIEETKVVATAKVENVVHRMEAPR